LRRWITDESDHFFLFDYAHTNSTATDVSVPSMLTGVAPWESGRKVHTLPLLWDWAKAGGMRTLFVSAKVYSWGNLNSFLLSPGPDIFVTPAEMKAPLFNDVGVDEMIAVRKFCDELRALPYGSRFLAMYNSSALHWPFQQTSPLLASEPRSASRYQNAAAILDEAFRELYSCLDSTGLLENTLLIMTSDHGDADKLEHGRVHRLYCFYDEITNIPFLIRTPRNGRPVTQKR
jgi:glucan phosphoethanolaminetransferase (alkaline phosphatase superfamily)